MRVFDADVRVRYQETDQMGVVYHANYLTWFEIGRTELIREAGVPYSHFEKRGILLPAVNLNVQYKSPARYDDAVTIRTSVKSFTGVRITFSYEVIRTSNHQLLVVGETEHVWVNQDFKPINLKKEWPEMAALIEEIKA